MSSKTLQYGEANTSTLDAVDLQPEFSFRTMLKKISAIFVRSEIEKAQTLYQLKKWPNGKGQRDLLSDLPLAEKQKLSMHQWM
jgi:hypothetical protein